MNQVLSAESFAILAGGRGGEPEISRLQTLETNNRTLVLATHVLPRMLASEDPACVSSVELAKRMDIEEPAALDEVFGLPMFGAWIGAIWNKASNLAPNEDPQAFTELARRLGGFAAAAACRANVDFELSTATDVEGQWHLPAFGRVRTGRPAQNIVVRRTSGRLAVVTPDEAEIAVLPEDLSVPGKTWDPARYLDAEAGGRSIRVLLDDLDRERNIFGWPADAQLTPERFGHWQTVFPDAWAILVIHYPHYATAIEAGLQSIVPLADAPLGMGRSATNEQAFGAAGMTTPADKVQLALGMIHEFLHSQLAGMWHAEELTNHVDVSLAYAPWRDDPRPVHKLLQGAYAHLGVADFWRTWRDVCEDPGRTTANLEYARWRQEVARTVEVIEKAGNLNQAGLQVLDHVKDRLHGWQDDVIPADALEYAMQGAADHELSWRVRNCRPDPQLIKEMATAWRRGEACPSGRELSATVIADNSGKDFTLAVRRARRTLLGRYLRSPDEFWQLAANESALQTLLPAATHADTFLVAGDIPAARREYAAQLIVAPHNTEPWGGLALTFRGQAPSEPAVTTLLQHPEYAAALYQALDGKADPLALAVWLG